MKRIKYIKPEKFFAKEYKDGVIVAFKNIGDNNSFYADQIHKIVIKSLGIDLFVSDIIESISSSTDSHKDSIKDSLFIYVKNDVSISACGIIYAPTKDGIEVKYNSEDVLSIRTNNRIFFNHYLRACILFIICILGYIVIVEDDKTNDLDSIVEPEIESQIEMPIKADKEDNNISANDVTVDNKEEVTPIITNDTSMVIAEDEGHVENENKGQSNSNIKNQQAVKCYVKEKYSYVEYKRKQDQEDAEREHQRKAMKAEANEYVRVADLAYNDYAESFDESKGIVALTNYKKALDLNKKHGLFFVSEREKIEQRINVLEKELK